MRGNVHVRFGGRGQENLRPKGRKASRPRPNTSTSTPEAQNSCSKS